MALENGADLVVELPFLTSVQSASYFCCWCRQCILSRLNRLALPLARRGSLDYQTIADVYAEKS